MPARLTSISSIFSFSSDNFCSPFSYCQLNVNLLRRISTCPTTRSRTSARWTPPPPSAPSTSRTTASTTSGEINAIRSVLSSYHIIVLSKNNVNDIRSNAFANLTLLTRLNLRGESMIIFSTIATFPQSYHHHPSWGLCRGEFLPIFNRLN